MRALRSLGLSRGTVVLALIITTGIFAFMAYEGNGGGVFGGVLIEVLLISFVQTGLTRTERIGFSLAAVSLGLLAVVAGTLAGGGPGH